MDEDMRIGYTEITVRIPDDLVRRLGAESAVERRILEALVIDEFRRGHISRMELSQLLDFATLAELDEFLTGHGVLDVDAAEEPKREVLPNAESRARARRAAANIITRRKGVTLDGLNIKDLINEGRL
jgi:hypothetical protein